MNVNWVKCTNGNWCDFNIVNLTHEHFQDMIGVYIIWSNQTVVRVGSGTINERIADHRTNSQITRYRDLKVTWAHIDEASMQGVEKYLADTLNPAVGDRFPDVPQIQVNLPW